MSDQSTALSQSNKYLLVGLGNPGRNHRNNRHNIGFMAIDRLADRSGINMSRVQHKAIVGDGRVANQAVILAKPQTYMNLSGKAVSTLVHFYKIPLSNMLVVYDEIDLPFGMLRLREQGGAGGHNGMRSIISHLGQEFPRLRLGVGRPPGRMEAAAYVLQDFGRGEQIVVEQLLDEALGAIETYLREGIDLAMTRHNGMAVEEE